MGTVLQPLTSVYYQLESVFSHCQTVAHSSARMEFLRVAGFVSDREFVVPLERQLSVLAPLDWVAMIPVPLKPQEDVSMFSPFSFACVLCPNQWR